MLTVCVKSHQCPDTIPSRPIKHGPKCFSLAEVAFVLQNDRAQLLSYLGCGIRTAIVNNKHLVSVTECTYDDFRYGGLFVAGRDGCYDQMPRPTEAELNPTHQQVIKPIPREENHSASLGSIVSADVVANTSFPKWSRGLNRLRS